jgi:hypothetical protein
VLPLEALEPGLDSIAASRAFFFFGLRPTLSLTDEAPDHIKENWPGSAWIVELITKTTKRKGERSVRRQLFITTVLTTPEASLRLIRQRWSIENEWHWARDTQLGEDTRAA